MPAFLFTIKHVPLFCPTLYEGDAVNASAPLVEPDATAVFFSIGYSDSSC